MKYDERMWERDKLFILLLLIFIIYVFLEYFFNILILLETCVKDHKACVLNKVYQ